MADSSTIEETENQTNEPGVLSGGESQLKEIFLNQSFTAGRFRISVKNITRVVYPKAKVLIEGSDLGIYDQIYIVFGNIEQRVKSFFPNPAISTFIEFELPDLNDLLVDGATVQVKLVSLRNKEASGTIRQNLIYYTKSSEEGQGEKDSTSNNQKSSGRSAVGGSKGVFEGGVGAVVDAAGAVMGGVVKPFVISGKASDATVQGFSKSSGVARGNVKTNVEDDFDSNDDVAEEVSVRGSVSQNVANEVNATVEGKQTVTQKTQASISESSQRIGQTNISSTQTTTVSGGGGASGSASDNSRVSGSTSISGGGSGGGQMQVNSQAQQTVSTQTNVEGNLGKTVNISANVNQSSPVSGKVEVNDKTNIDVKVKSQNVGKSKVETQIGASSSGVVSASSAGGRQQARVEVNDSSNVDIQGGRQGLSSPGKKVSVPAGQSLGSSSLNQQSQPSGSVATLEQESPAQTIGVNVQRSAGPLGGLNVSEAISSKQNGVDKVFDNRPDKVNQPISQPANTKGVEPNQPESKNNNENKEKQNEPGEKPLAPLKPKESKNPDQPETNPKEKENPEFKNKLNKFKDNDAALQRALPPQQGSQQGSADQEPSAARRSPNVQPGSKGEQGGGGGAPQDKEGQSKQQDPGQEGKDLGKKDRLPGRDSDNEKPQSPQSGQKPSNLTKPDKKPESISPVQPEESALPGPLSKVSKAKDIIEKSKLAGKGIGQATSKVWYYGLGISAGVFFSGLDFFVGALIMDAYWIFGHRKDKNLFPLSLWQKVVTIFANLAPFLYAAVIVVLIAIAGCNYPVGKISGSYKLSYMGIAGYGEVCEALESAGSGLGVTGETGGAVPIIPGGVCSVAASGPASVENLASTCFGANAGKASAIAVAESGGNPVSMSRVDKCGNDSVSVGLFQINLTAHRVAGLNCPSAFNRRYDGPSSACQVINRPLYDACVAAAKLPENNIQEACRISGNGQSWSAWGANRRCGF